MSKKTKTRKYLLKYDYDDLNDIFYKDEECYKHFLKIVANYPYWDIAKQYITVFIEPNNNQHTSYFDDEAKEIHLLYCHIEKYTVIHELTHFIQYLTGYGKNYYINKMDGYDDIVKKYIDKNNLEPYISFLDILNSATFGKLTKYLGGSHTEKYYNDDLSLAIQEMHSNYCSLLYCNQKEFLEEIPTEILNEIIKYDMLIQEKLKDILDNL